MYEPNRFYFENKGPEVGILIVLTDWLVLLLCVYLLAVGISVFKHPVKPSINRDIGEIHYVP